MIDKEKEWLASLKVGDEVCYSRGAYGHTVTKIKKITPTGQIVLENGNRAKDGRIKVGSGTWASTYWIKPVTDKIKEDLLKAELIYGIGNTNLHGLTLQQLKGIYDIIYKENKEPVD